MPKSNGLSEQACSHAESSNERIDVWDRAISKIDEKLGKLVDSVELDAEQSKIVSHNLSPLPGPGQPSDKIFFPLGALIDEIPAESKRTWYRLRGSERIEWIPRGIIRTRPFAARSIITLIPDVPGGTLGQQIAYILVLKATFSNSWADLAKVYNDIWNHLDILVVEFDPDRPQHWRQYPGIRPYPEASKDEVRDMWRHQTIYKRDSESMRAELEKLKSRQDFLCRYPDNEGIIMGSYAGFHKLMADIERSAGYANVKLKKLDVDKQIVHNAEVGHQNGKIIEQGAHKADVKDYKMKDGDQGAQDTEIMYKSSVNDEKRAHKAFVSDGEVGNSEQADYETELQSKKTENGEQGRQAPDANLKEEEKAVASSY